MFTLLLIHMKNMKKVLKLPSAHLSVNWSLLCFFLLLVVWHCWCWYYCCCCSYCCIGFSREAEQKDDDVATVIISDQACPLFCMAPKGNCKYRGHTTTQCKGLIVFFYVLCLSLICKNAFALSAVHMNINSWHLQCNNVKAITKEHEEIFVFLWFLMNMR